MFAWEDGAVLRLLRDPNAHVQNGRQRAAMEAARASGVRVPAVLETVTVMGRPGLVMERVDGPDLLTVIARRPQQVFWVARVCGELQAQLHTVPAPENLPGLHEAIRQSIERAGQIPAPLAAFALDLLARLPEGDRLCHGDFHPGNVLLAADGPVIIDWTNAVRGHPDADLARTVLLLRLGEPPPGAPLALRLLALLGRRVLLAAHLRAYRRRRPVHPGRLARWEAVLAADRLTEEIAGETPALLRLLEQRRRTLGSVAAKPR